ncbi:hypothetical protein CLAFUW4_07070 [Fulvia fulva]|uniref:Uncharacterized protein n=1 Tax=Passalora fulva TaxID=5499 RepID=A0A9Q8PB36_PASFU|nr:uncharacterized protein CLAFUR5_07206 [Fulvia fulva]KAK4622077.1 hypothetical protein CLAFUR4_07079 [Fulvia fulva]KAK4623266.1 hypothetical protein CLAFUR0_07077 [Fulvia fulva]UJO19220.1 hypothetical protein CLAFUR5_07206 [Fulvia fulva]WPV16755.1 hypothetical protein CLAFUW4_07070 [Fulvia fulva]WPV31420.1 hypothetical protein CLAFUW7_07070 [Fulvia fulva]
MLLSPLPTLVLSLLLATNTLANLHSYGVCVKDRVQQPIGGTAGSVSYTWSDDYTILAAETECACNYYKARNTGSEQWDTCPDCTYNGLECQSDGWHIGGNEVSERF